MKCPNCSKELRDDSNFCTGCGRAIPRCPTCGKVLQHRVRFCTDDGTPIPDEINALLPDKSVVPSVTEEKQPRKPDKSKTKPPKKNDMLPIE